jgi:hypothetical protein
VTDDPTRDLEPGSDPASIRHDPRLLRAAVDVRDFALVTYLVPAERIRPHLPAGVRLQGFRDDDGRDQGFVTASCFRNHRLRWAGGPSPGMTLYQSTYRTYVRVGRDVGAFFFSSYVETVAGTWAQKLGLADTRRARFTVAITRGPRGGYPAYRAEMRADDGTAVLDVVATDEPAAVTPFGSPQEHVRFVTHRLHGYSRSLLGVPVEAQVEHPEMPAFGGRLVEGRFPSLERLRLVDRDGQARPHSVLVSPGVRFELLAPVPLRVRRPANPDTDPVRRRPVRGAGR